MNNRRFYIAFGVAMALLLSLSTNVCQLMYHNYKTKEWQALLVHRDSVTVIKTETDTVKVAQPKEKETVLVETVRVRVDTVKTNNTDTLYIKGDSVDIPITQTRCTDDSTYTAWVSGYRARLDSVNVYQKTRYITTTITQPALTKKRGFLSRFNVGLQGGYGYGIESKQWQPFVGVGLSYNLIK